MTDFSFLVNPNLPDGNVQHVVVSPQYPEIISSLKNSGVIPLTVSSCNRVLYPLRNHADMLFSYLGNGIYAVEQSQNTLSDELKKLGFGCVCDCVKLSDAYPEDIPLNFCLIGKYLICKKNSTHDLFIRDREIIDVRQGYAKCSCVPIDSNSLITDDLSIYNICLKFGLDVLLVRKGFVRLDGFDTGFIGGCCGKLAEDTLAFCGDISNHPDYLQINAFLRERNVFPVSLTDGELIDIGSIIPVTQNFDCT